ncbi:MAG TPA: lytic transglycosylase domain-containing protein [Candidatus Binataceae bacterium]|nr:lytic transglycosylase domain-containing protein [Candidatus Binataceae bacterium]
MKSGGTRLIVVVGLATLVCGLVAGYARGQETADRAVDQHALFAAVGAMYQLDPDLLTAIARTESGGVADAVSPAGAQGLMQLMPATARRFGVDHPFDPVESALGAAQYLDQLRAASPAGGQLTDLLAAYNAGEGAVRRYGGIPPYAETRRYVERVLRYYLLDPPVGPTPLASAPRRAASIRSRAVPLPVPLDGERQVLDQLAELKSQRAAALAENPSR